MSIAQIYAQTLRNSFGKYFATWLPNSPLELGDFGYVKDDVFTRRSNVKKAFKLKFGVKEDSQLESHYDYRSEDSTILYLEAGAKAADGNVLANSAVQIKFGSENSVFFNAAGCTVTSIDDQEKFSSDILDLFKLEKWNDDWYIVTSLVHAGPTVAIVTRGNNALVELQAEGKTDKIDLADASVKIGISHEDKVGFKSTISNGCFPLMGLSKVRRKWFQDPDVIPQFVADPHDEDTLALRQECLEKDVPISKYFEFASEETKRRRRVRVQLC